MDQVRPATAPVTHAAAEGDAVSVKAAAMRRGGSRMLGRHGASGLRIALGLLLGAVFMLLVLRTVDLDAVGELLANAAVLPIGIAVLAFALDFVLRAARFCEMLRLATGRRVPLRAAVSPYVASFGVSDILPLRIGDGFRILWFSRRFGVPVGTLVGIMIVERLFDLLTILVLCGLCLAWVDAPDGSVLVLTLRVTLLVSVVAGLALLLAPALLSGCLRHLARRFSMPLPERPIEVLRASADAIACLGSLRRIGWLAILSLALWLLESIAMTGAWLSLGGAGDAVFKPFLAFAFSTLGTMVPSLPGHFGTFEFFGLQAFRLAAVDESMAAAVLLLAHLVIWLPTALFGVVWLLFGASVSDGGPLRASRPRIG